MMGVKLSRGTLRRTLQAWGLRTYATIPRPRLNQSDEANRLAFTEHVLRDPIILRDLCYTDEHKVNVECVRRGRVWSAGPAEPQRFVSTDGHAAYSCQVWGAVSVKEGGMFLRILPVVERGEQTQSAKHDAITYAGVLTEFYESVWVEKGGGVIFMDDNCRMHRSGDVAAHLHRFRRLAYWPPRSPEFNAIEYVWREMDMRLEAYKHLVHDYQSFLRAVQVAFYDVATPDRVLGHVQSVLGNVQAVNERKGSNKGLELPFRHPYAFKVSS